MINGSPGSADLAKFILVNACTDAAVCSMFAALMLFTNTFGIYSHTHPIWPAAVFFGGCVTSFTTTAVSTAIARQL